ncbi:hypothetical protein [Streptomyces mirabilis]|uniref:hypothetical protein n=1 Tax=Streptomyces mirabilis TaxID=68239 RepID=UPI0033BB07F0
MDANPQAVRPHAGEPVAWIALDDYLLYACHVVYNLVVCRLGDRLPIPTAVRFGLGKCLWL